MLKQTRPFRLLAFVYFRMFVVIIWMSKYPQYKNAKPTKINDESELWIFCLFSFTFSEWLSIIYSVPFLTSECFIGIHYVRRCDSAMLQAGKEKRRAKNCFQNILYKKLLSQSTLECLKISSKKWEKSNKMYKFSLFLVLCYAAVLGNYRKWSICRSH